MHHGMAAPLLWPLTWHVGAAGGVANKYGAPFEVDSCKKAFFKIYLAKYAGEWQAPSSSSVCCFCLAAAV